MTNYHVALVAVFVLCTACYAGALPQASDASCDFSNDVCSWMNDTGSGINGVFMREFNATNIDAPATGCHYISVSYNEPKGSVAKINSTVFAIQSTTVVLQVNFSYWMKNSQGTTLKLYYIDETDAIPYKEVWNSTVLATVNWNATSVNIKNISGKTETKLVFHGAVGSPQDGVAVERIVVKELTAQDVPDASKLPDSISHEEKPGDANLCAAGAGMIQSSIILTMIGTCALMFGLQRF